MTVFHQNSVLAVVDDETAAILTASDPRYNDIFC